jgi:hypothetical protein
MRRCARAFVALLAAAVLWAAVSVPPQAHEGHDHGAPPPPVTRTIAPRAEASSPDLELVAVARGAELILHLDTFRENEPVAGAAIEIDVPAGILSATEREAGVYAVAAPFVTRPGKYDLAFTITAGDTVDVLTASLEVPAPSADGAAGTQAGGWALVGGAVASELKRRVTGWDAAVLAAAGAGFLAGLAVAFAFRRRRTAAIVVAAALLPTAGLPAARADEATAPAFAVRDVAQRFPDGAIFVPKATQRILAVRTVLSRAAEHRRSIELPGRVIADPNASGVVQASVGGRLLPPPGGFRPLGARVTKGEVLALVEPPINAADMTTLGEQARQLDQQRALVVRRLERLKAIESVVARSQIEDAQIELAGIDARRAAMDGMKRQPEPLSAPVDGVIASADAVAGQMAEPSSVIFRIIDPTRLRVEALSFSPQALSDRAEARLEGGRTLQLALVGSGTADRNQAVPVHFSVAGGSEGIRIGELVTVFASTRESVAGMSIPRNAVVRGPNGLSLVYEHSAAERFVPREVRVAPLDGRNVLVISGLEPGRRVVTQGAELLGQIR